MYAGRFEDAIKEADAVHQLNPSHLKAFVARALSLLALDRSSGGSRQLRPAGGRRSGRRRRSPPPDAATWPSITAATPRPSVSWRPALPPMSSARTPPARPPSGSRSRRRIWPWAIPPRRRARRRQAASGCASDTIRTGAGLVLAAAGQPKQAETLAVALNNKLEADPQAYGRLVQAEEALARKDARKAVELAREAQKYADTWLGQVTLGRAYLGLNAYPEAYSAFEAALKRRGEATAVFLDDVPTYRRLPAVYYEMGVAQAGLRSSAAPSRSRSTSRSWSRRIPTRCSTTRVRRLRRSKAAAGDRGSADARVTRRAARPRVSGEMPARPGSSSPGR